jgi:hypothetical protein
MQGGLAGLILQVITEENADNRKVLEETVANFQMQASFFSALKVSVHSSL